MGTNTQIANTILEQLGGNRFVTMTGAKQFVAGERNLTFSLPRRFAKNGINKVRITLDVTDTYTIEFFVYKSNKAELKTIHEDSYIYYNQLQENFTRRTGMHTHL